VDSDIAPILCAVIGAVATRLYMSERLTGDIDVAVRKTDLVAAGERLEATGYEYVGELAIGGSTWRSSGGQEVDLVAGEEDWWADAIEQAQRNRDAEGLPCVPLPYLVLMKLRSSRAQDLADVSRMMGQADSAPIEETLALVGRHAPKDVPDLRSLIDLGRLELS
jgi:hypothetical protein